MMTQAVLSTFGQVFGWIVPFLVVLGVVVVVHELGHFIAARLLGVAVDTFSIGFGPEITGFYDRSGTRWRIAWIPLGGYVKFKGDESAASNMPSREQLDAVPAVERKGNFHFAPVWRRALIVVAGPLSNFVLSIVIFTGIVLATGIIYQEARILCVEPGTPAAKAGLEAGDRIVAVGGEPVRTFEDFSLYVKMNARSAIDIAIDRSGKPLMLQAVPELTDNECLGRLGVVGSSDSAGARVVKPGVFEAAGEGVRRTWRILEQPFQFFGQLFRGNSCANALSGPVKIAEVSKTAASQGFVYLLPLIGFISASIGLFNLFPIPVLDGGHLLFYGAEAILGRPLSRKAQEMGFQIGFALLLMLMVFATWNDIKGLVRGMTPPKKIESVCNR